MTSTALPIAKGITTSSAASLRALRLDQGSLAHDWRQPPPKYYELTRKRGTEFGATVDAWQRLVLAVGHVLETTQRSWCERYVDFTKVVTGAEKPFHSSHSDIAS